ncbi:MAG: hypothetical protein HY529_03220 [Chloroflexi bacterium]|nr:hypothetical protein [Chloroflexota bacterium]
MKLSTILIVLICLLIGLGGGYSTGYLKYQPKITALEIQVSKLIPEVSNLTSAVSGLTQNIAEQKDQISDLQIDKSRLQADLDRTQQQIRSYQEQTLTLNEQLVSTQKRLDKVLAIKVTQSYQWDYQSFTGQVDLPIPLAVYAEYLERPRPKSASYWVDMTKDPKDDPYIDQLIQQINKAALVNGLSEIQKLNFVIAFVQSLPYTVDIETTPFDEYPRYPIETLFDRGGDCEDTSILVAAILDRMGYDVALLLLRNAYHMAVGIALPDGFGAYYQQNGKKYFYLETTGEGWQIGEFPPSITDPRAQVYPLKN